MMVEGQAGTRCRGRRTWPYAADPLTGSPRAMEKDWTIRVSNLTSPLSQDGVGAVVHPVSLRLPLSHLQGGVIQC